MVPWRPVCQMSVVALLGLSATGLAAHSGAVAGDAAPVAAAATAPSQPAVEPAPASHPPARPAPGGPPPSRPPVAPGTGSGEGGNVVVYVPATPPPGVIKAFCNDYLAGRTPPANRWLPGFTAETGGSAAASTAWCQTFVALARHRPAPEGAGR